MTVVDTTLSDDRTASLFNVWIDLNEPTDLSIAFSMPHIRYEFAQNSAYLSGSLITFELENEHGLFSPSSPLEPMGILLDPRVYIPRTVKQLPKGLHRLGVKLIMGMDGKVYIDSMLLAVKKAG